jgi:hypothetical protein
LRNYRCCGRVVPINAEAGWLFWLSNHARADGGYGTPSGAYFPRGDVNLADRDRYLMRAGVRWVREHPVEWLRLCVRKWQRFWSPATMGHASEVRLPQAFLAAYALFLVCAAVGAVRTLRIWREGRLLHAVCAYFVLIALLFYGCTRFALPIAPCLCLFAADGAYWALGVFSPQRRRERPHVSPSASLAKRAVRKPGCLAPPTGASDA